jgi:hypothetical protein
MFTAACHLSPDKSSPFPPNPVSLRTAHLFSVTILHRAVGFMGFCEDSNEPSPANEANFVE